jgi:AcrR family transcriptional regulator
VQSFSVTLVRVSVVLASSRRERKKQATRRAIHEAAFTMVEEHGLSGVTVEAISDRAGVAPRTFWSYFSSKEDAVLDRDPARPEGLRAALLGRPPDEDILTALRRVLDEDLAGRVVDRSRALRRGLLVRGEPQLMAAVAATYDEIERALVQGVAERMGLDPDTDLFPGLIVNAVCGAYRIAQLRWSDRKGRPSLQDLVDEAFEHLARGLAPSPLERSVG